MNFKLLKKQIITFATLLGLFMGSLASAQENESKTLNDIISKSKQRNSCYNTEIKKVVVNPNFENQIKNQKLLRKATRLKRDKSNFFYQLLTTPPIEHLTPTVKKDGFLHRTWLCAKNAFYGTTSLAIGLLIKQYAPKANPIITTGLFSLAGIYAIRTVTTPFIKKQKDITLAKLTLNNSALQRDGYQSISGEPTLDQTGGKMTIPCTKKQFSPGQPAPVAAAAAAQPELVPVRTAAQSEQ